MVGLSIWGEIDDTMIIIMMERVDMMMMIMMERGGMVK